MKNRYTFIMEHCDKTANTFSGRNEGIQEVLEDFKTFLLGCTYSPNNVDCIQYIDEESLEEKLQRYGTKLVTPQEYK